jgi:chloride channel 7
VLCNDRAPARRREIDGSKQRSHLIPFRAYADYVRKRDGVAGTVFDDRRTPFYANGMRVFSECKRADALSRAFPRPYFTHECDNTETLLMATTNELGSILKFDSEIALRMRDSVSKSLDKMFVGPRGALTRLHYDAGDAHGWLGQVEGRKLFVFYPPSASPMLYPIEDSHASVDPLEPDYDRFPLFREARSRARVCVLNPGEVVLCPRRWWHYAVALDTSVTVMRNWYNVNTNAQALVEQICSTIKQTVDNRAKGSVPRNEASR